jgi:hypothetical protein
MKPHKPLILLTAFLFVSQAVFGDFNIFSQRKIIIGDFENRGSSKYDYIGNSLGTAVYSYILLIPFITVSDRERSFLEYLSGTDEFKTDFINAGNVIGYRLVPDIERRPITGTSVPFAERSWPLYIYGSYRVLTEDDVSVSFFVYNSMTGSMTSEYRTQTTLYSLLNEPHTYLIPFFKNFLKYSIYTATIEAVPADSLIFIDDRLVGIGAARNILIPRGQHRLTIRSDGYKVYTDFINVTDDKFYKQVELKVFENPRRLLLITDPGEADVYLNEEFIGKTPLELTLSDDNQILTLVKEGHDRLVMNTKSISPDVKTLKLKLTETELTAKRYAEAEKHLKRSKILSYTGIGMLGMSIFLGTEKTLFDQKADLYRGSAPNRFEDARLKADVFTYLTVASSVITSGIFAYSFIEMIRYFNLYSQTSGGPEDTVPPSEYGSADTIKIIYAEVRF